jgi:hypothetical protein
VVSYNTSTSTAIDRDACVGMLLLTGVRLRKLGGVCPLTQNGSCYPRSIDIGSGFRFDKLVINLRRYHAFEALIRRW